MDETKMAGNQIGQSLGDIKDLKDTLSEMSFHKALVQFNTEFGERNSLGLKKTIGREREKKMRERGDVKKENDGKKGQTLIELKNHRTKSKLKEEKNNKKKLTKRKLLKQGSTGKHSSLIKKRIQKKTKSKKYILKRLQNKPAKPKTSGRSSQKETHKIIIKMLPLDNESSFNVKQSVLKKLNKGK